MISRSSLKFIEHFILLFLITSCSTPQTSTHTPTSTPTPTPNPTAISDPRSFDKIFYHSEYRNRVQIQGLVGRVLKGKTFSDFASLSDNPDRKLIFLMGEDGLQSILGSTQQEILLKIGYTPDYITRLKTEGYTFKLVIFNSTETNSLPATWDNVIQFVKDLYPSISKILDSASTKLKTTSFSEIQKSAPMNFSEVDKLGKGHPFYFDEKKLLLSEKNLWQIRSFLYHQARLTELFSGDGSTYSSSGEKQLKEYIVINRPISEISNAILIDL